MISYDTFSEALQQVGRKPNSSQKLAVEAAKDDALFVVAGPGTGKTACLTMRMLKLVRAYMETVGCLKSVDHRSQCRVIFWQEIARACGKDLKEFLRAKYGIY